MSSSPRDLLERHIGRLAVCPGDVDRRWGIARRVDLIDDEVPFRVVTIMIGERSGTCRNDLCVRGLADCVLPGRVGARRTRTEKHEYETDQGEHSSEE